MVSISNNSIWKPENIDFCYNGLITNEVFFLTNGAIFFTFLRIHVISHVTCSKLFMKLTTL